MRTSFRALPVALAATGLLLAGCGGSSSPSEDTPAPAAAPSGSSAGSGSAPAAATTAVKLVKDGLLTVCTTLPYAPFEQTVKGEDEPVGFDIALADLVATAVGAKVHVIDTPFETIKGGTALNSGQCDVAAAGMTITDERKKNLDFSVPYFDATQALLAAKGSGVTDLASAKGKKVGAQSGTTGEAYAKDNGLKPVSFKGADGELNGLRARQVDVIIQDLPVVTEWLKDSANAKYEIVANLDTGEQYGFAVKKGNADLLKVVDDTFTKAKSDGTYDTLYKKWIGQDVPSADPAPSSSS